VRGSLTRDDLSIMLVALQKFGNGTPHRLGVFRAFATIPHEHAIKHIKDALQVRVRLVQGTKSSICVTLWAASGTFQSLDGGIVPCQPYSLFTLTVQNVFMTPGKTQFFHAPQWKICKNAFAISVRVLVPEDGFSTWGRTKLP
jgi:hypothetical protein